MLYLDEGSPTTMIDESRAEERVARLLERLGRRRRILLIPPDHTRIHSWAGTLAGMVYRQCRGFAQVDVLPALGTHSPMTETQLKWMYPDIPLDHFHVHDWRRDLVPLGEVPAALVHDLSEGRFSEPIPIEVNRRLLDGYDLMLSIGQLVPHEVVGIANHSKNIFIGVGGARTVHRTHFLGAVYGMERMMGRAKTPVRTVLSYASQQFTRDWPIAYLLTVRSRNEQGNLVTRGLFAGDDDECFERGAELCRAVNLDLLDEPIDKVVVWLDPHEFKSTWLGNKAIYRTRMALADDGELVILAPGVREFGEDRRIDQLIRQHGYRGTPETLERVARSLELAENLSAAAHLIHGSTEGRFRVTYAAGGLRREDIEGVGFSHGSLDELSRRYDPKVLRDGWNQMPDGERVFFISHPGLGLWGARDRFAEQ